MPLGSVAVSWSKQMVNMNVVSRPAFGPVGSLCISLTVRLNKSLTEHHCPFLTITIPCQACDMVKGTTAVFIVSVSGSASTVCPVPVRSLFAVASLPFHTSSTQLNKNTFFSKARRWPGKINVGQEFFVFSVHLIVVTQGPLVLDCLLQITHIIPTGSEIIH